MDLRNKSGNVGRASQFWLLHCSIACVMNFILEYFECSEFFVLLSRAVMFRSSAVSLAPLVLFAYFSSFILLRSYTLHRISYSGEWRVIVFRVLHSYTGRQSCFRIVKCYIQFPVLF